jgi:aryl-alcohol dehydrogenase-like predicted oxidoreductase
LQVAGGRRLRLPASADGYLGKALRNELTSERNELVIATKGVLRQAASGVMRDASPEWLRRGVDASLTALGVDHIDLYQVHWPDPTVPAAETAGALSELVSDGKISHVGVSNYNAWQMAEFSATLSGCRLGVRRGDRGEVVGGGDDVL